MTDVDPLECLNSRAAADKPTCGEPEIAHCAGCQGCPGHCVCRNASPLDKHWLAQALDAFALNAGATSWQALADATSHTTADHYRDLVTAAIAPLQAEIRRLTAERAGLAIDLDTEIENAPAPCFTEDDYAAGFIAGLSRALELAAPTTEVDNLKHSKETS